jgi:hypothetical protein
VINLNNEIKYNVNSIINTTTETKEELVKVFNEKLLRIIVAIEKNSKVINCQD